MKILERVYPFACPHCDGSGSQTHWDNGISPSTYNPYDHMYHGLETVPMETHIYQPSPDYERCSLCKGSTRIWLTEFQLEPVNLAAMGLALPDTGPQIRNVTIQPRNRTEKSV